MMDVVLITAMLISMICEVLPSRLFVTEVSAGRSTLKKNHSEGNVPVRGLPMMYVYVKYVAITARQTECLSTIHSPKHSSRTDL